MSASGNSAVTVAALWGDNADDLAVVLFVAHLGYVTHRLFNASLGSPADPFLYVFIPIDIFALYFFLARWVRRIGNFPVAVTTLLASLCGILMSVFLADAALTSSGGLPSQVCLFAASTILLCEVLYVRRLILSRTNLTGGIRAIQL